ncbi:hypothetical protein [Uliginosibacterium sp. 31-12]|uniref:hypothetical protein n=1 Tax=Uliginosibacterium sp. 31-12 TaxID=3062781 RepID=UPI0026E48BC7|nr:hypothetical protein [Uliginosibacterium sp. 31-12]MDO6388479.1 hypothetical protein [Uliginosibacterium sp. 31-12]
MYSDATHWKLVTILARVFGLMAVFAAVVGAISAVKYWLHPELAEKISTLGGNASIEAAMVSVFCLCVGFPFLFVKPFRPDIKDGKNNHTQSSTGKVSWWTGEPKT